MRVGRRLQLLAAAPPAAAGGVGVGGGSLVYGNTLFVPREPFFDSPIIRALGGAGGLMPYFAGEGEARKGCTFCGGGFIGCRVGAKNTLDRNYLYFAERLGCVVVPETRVTSIQPLSDDGGAGYLLDTARSTSWLGHAVRANSESIVAVTARDRSTCPRGSPPRRASFPTSARRSRPTAAPTGPTPSEPSPPCWSTAAAGYRACCACSPRSCRATSRRPTSLHDAWPRR